MPLISRKGSVEELSPQGVPVSETRHVTDRNQYVADAQDYDKLVHVENTFTTMTPTNPARYPEVYKMLMAYPKGFKMVVPYYHRRYSSDDIRSFPTSISIEDDASHMDTTKIHNLEMRLEESLQVTELEEDKSSQLTGNAVMYPGLEPYEGDMFLMEVGNNKIVMFIVNKVSPTTYRQERYYKISFFAYSTVDSELYKKLESTVTNNVFFEVKKYFGESELTFLSEDKYKHLKDLEMYKKKIVQDIINYFYCRDAQSFFRPDGIYDPYITEFLRSKVTVRDYNIRPLQLLVPLLDYDHTIWYSLIDANNYACFSNVYQYANLRYKDPRNFRSDINGLTGRYYLEISKDNTNGLSYPSLKTYDDILSIGPDGCCAPTDPSYPHLLKQPCHVRNHHPNNRNGYFHDPYLHCSDQNEPIEKDGVLLSPSFYAGMISDLSSDIEKLLYAYLKQNRSIDVTKLLDLLFNYRKLGITVTSYYIWTFYLELIDGAIVNIR